MAVSTPPIWRSRQEYHLRFVLCLHVLCLWLFLVLFWNGLCYVLSLCFVSCLPWFLMSLTCSWFPACLYVCLSLLYILSGLIVSLCWSIVHLSVVSTCLSVCTDTCLRYYITLTSWFIVDFCLWIWIVVGCVGYLCVIDYLVFWGTASCQVLGLYLKWPLCSFNKSRRINLAIFVCPRPQQYIA